MYRERRVDRAGPLRYGVGVVSEPEGHGVDPALRRILEELRDLRLESRADRQQAAADRQQAVGDRRQADQRYADLIRDSDARHAELMRESATRHAKLMRESAAHHAKIMRRSDERFEKAIREFREDNNRHAAETRAMFKDIRTVGLSMVKTLNRHTRILERIDRKLGARGNGFGPSNGRA
jgi:hypothetical protein